MEKDTILYDCDIPDLHKFGHIDDFWLSYKWSNGGIIHEHIALWIAGGHRVDCSYEVKVDSEEVHTGVLEAHATHMATFWDRIITEFNVAKAVEGHNDAAAKVSPISRCASADAPEAFVDLAADTDANAKQATDNDGPWRGSYLKSQLPVHQHQKRPVLISGRCSTRSL